MNIFLRNIRVKLENIRSYFTTIQPLMRLLWRASPSFLITSLSLTLLIGLLPLVSIFITSTLLQTLVQTTTTPSTQSKSVLPTQFILLLILITGANLLMQLIQRLNTALHDLHRMRFTNYVQLLVAAKASEIDFACFEDPDFHNQMSIAANEASYRTPMFLDRLLVMSSALITFCSLAVVIILWHAWIVPVIFVASLATLWVSTHFGTARVNVITRRAETERKKFYFNTLLTSDQAAKEIRLFGLRDFLLTSLRTLLETTYKQDQQLVLRDLLYSGLAGTLLALVQPALIAFTAFQTIQGAITIGQFNLYTQSIIQLEGGVTQLTFVQGGLHESNLFAGRLFRFLAMQPHVEAQHMETKEQHITISPTPHIEFRNVTFCYSGNNYPVLKNVSFEIRPGEAIALVGENGAGKTTIIKLLGGLYEPTEGQILLDGVDIQTLDRDKLRAYLSVIFQDYTIYHLSTSENIGVGQVNWRNDLVRIEEAARRSGLDRVIAQLPNGYDTVLGRFWEKGHELSGGQRQLVALARALLREAPILILDEPSAALDIYTERHFFQQLLKDHDDGQLQTVIFISHRFTTIRHADRILVLENGCLTEQGSHEKLLAQNGHYAEMFNLQAALYNNSLVKVNNGIDLTTTL